MVAWGSARIAAYQHAVLIHNPYAGRIRNNPRLLEEVQSALAPLATEWEILATSGPGMGGGLAAERVAAGADLVLAMGGDGTLNEVMQGVAGTGAVLGLVPAGTANVLAMETGIGGDTLRAAARLREARPVEIALGCLHPAGGAARMFVAMAGVGLDAGIVRRVQPGFKRRFGKLSYWLAGFGAVGQRLHEFEITLDGRPYRASYALLSRVRNYGGDLEIARHASLLRDDLAVVLFEGENSLRYLKYFGGVLLNRLSGMKGVHVLHAREVEVRPLNGRAVDVQLDGEYAGVAPLRISCGARRVRLLLPPEFIDRAG